MYGIGLMSGTSLDGIDAVLIDIDGNFTDTKISIIEFITEEIPKNIKEEIKICCDKNTSNVELICELNYKMGYIFADAVKKVCEKAKFPLEKVDYIASHGQTIYHIPNGKNRLASTLQIGEPAIISYETNTKVISNFRAMDIAGGGDGAPLVPYSEFVLYASKDKTKVFQNIGGIGNASVLPKGAELGDMYAFDTGPGNMMIDEAVQILFNKKYDKDGEIAKKGNLREDILDVLMQNEYLRKEPPKSTGREMFGEQYVKEILHKYKDVDKYDLVKTFTMFTAKSIADSYKQFIFPKVSVDEVIVSGGGAYNITLMELIKGLLPNIKVMTQEDIGHSSEAKEAIAFAILGNETLALRPSNTPRATGAKDRLILGNITNAPF